MNKINFDGVIIGGGLSGLFLAHHISVSKKGGDGARYAIIEPRKETLLDQTFCSWWPKDQLSHKYIDTVSEQWDRFRVVGPSEPPGFASEPFKMADYVYQRIPGQALKAKIMAELIADERFVFFKESVLQINEDPHEALVSLSGGDTIHTQKVWSSVAVGTPDLFQHFLGFEIETEQDFFQADVVDLMDFRVEQPDQVQFVYVLPFSKRSGLVEFTVFSENIFEPEKYEVQLRRFLQEQFGLIDFEVKRVEVGSVPMTLNATPAFCGKNFKTRIIPIGSAAGKTKATSGFSFARNLKVLEPSPVANRRWLWRFELYDSLLLGLMKTEGASGSQVFSQLFKKNDSNRIFKFLDEESNLPEEIKIFLSLRWAPFLRQLGLKYPFFFLGLLTLVLPHPLDWFIPLAGLALVGIPHGSLDHKLNPKEQSSWEFYLKYIFGVFLFLGLWVLAPFFALLCFIFISADHFGECQFIRLIQATQRSQRIVWFARLWGLSAALFSTLANWKEAQLILATLTRSDFFMSLPAKIPFGALSIIGFLGLFAASKLDTDSNTIFGRPAVALPATIMLFVFFALAPLLPGFLIFFCFWHSWDSIDQQRKTKGWTALEYLKLATPMTLMALLGCVGIFWLLNGVGFSERALSALFILLGALTFSHARLMKSFYFLKT